LVWRCVFALAIASRHPEEPSYVKDDAGAEFASSEEASQVGLSGTDLGDLGGCGDALRAATRAGEQLDRSGLSKPGDDDALD
jgi:hypothetical protein